jgi:radical SAM superfamily enzyme YgiQ (UPF0313 family)
MVIKRVSFIEAGSPGLHIFSKFPIPRLGAVLLPTILRERGYEVKAFIEDVAEPDWSFIESSDLVCISTITSTAIRAYRMAKRLKALDIPVIIGGTHPTFLPDEALEYADFVIMAKTKQATEEIRPRVEQWLHERGLKLKDEKTRIIHRDEGFNFLGFHIRMYNGEKLIIKPQKKRLKIFWIESEDGLMIISKSKLEVSQNI